MTTRGLLTRQLAFAKHRAQGLSVEKAYRAAGYAGATVNGYRLENRPDVAAAIDTFKSQRENLLSQHEGNPVRAEDLADLGFARNYLIDSLLTALAQAKAAADAKTAVVVVGKIVDLLSITFNPGDLAENDQSTAALLAQLGALK